MRDHVVSDPVAQIIDQLARRGIKPVIGLKVSVKDWCGIVNCPSNTVSIMARISAGRYPAFARI